MEFRRCCYVLLLQMVLAFTSYRTTHGQEGFSIEPVNTTAKIAFPARLDCQPTNPDAFIRWTVSGSLAINKDTCPGCQILTNGSLYISSVMSSHANRYTCFIPAGSDMFTVYLTVAESPRIMPTSSNMEFVQDGTLQINVDISGVPPPNVTWRFNGADIVSDPRITTADTSLTITNVQHTDAGMYSVTAENCADIETEEYNVVINFQPFVTLIRIPDSATVGVGAIVNLTCNIVSYPQSNVIFQQRNSEGIVVQNYTQMGVMHTVNSYPVISTSRFQFNDDDITGPSKFCCVAVNNFGSTRECLSFRKIGTPEPPVLQATPLGPTSIAVAWNMLSSVTYRLHYRMQGGNIWILVSDNIPSDETTRTLTELTANRVYEIEIRATTIEGSLPSPPNSTLAMTTPAKIQGLMLDSVSMRGSFNLTWQAPTGGPPLNEYIIHIMVMGSTSNRTLSGASTTWRYTNPTSNTVYQFTIQAINDGGAGPKSDAIMGFFCKVPSITSVDPIVEGSTFLNISWTVNNPLRLEANGTIFTVKKTTGNSREMFTSDLVPSGSSHQCFSDLQPDTLYTIEIVAVYACDNTSFTRDVRTAVGLVNDVSSTDGCLVYRPISTPTGDPESDNNLEGWQIALIIVVPLVAVVIMLSIGIYCACRRKSHNSELEIGAISNMNNKVYTQVHHDHARNNSSSSVTGTSYRSGSITPLTPTRSNLPYSSNNRSPTWNQPVDMTRLQEQTTGTSV
ncbi:neural cell adhesion molecule 1-like isoform X2 [Dysidea avara]|uniref:neural cell adhesion molecule 1-like isoform X2 n=1 Tax=Dysidea avara TaxID=196820 RepID=UPI003323E362